MKFLLPNRACVPGNSGLHGADDLLDAGIDEWLRREGRVRLLPEGAEQANPRGDGPDFLLGDRPGSPPSSMLAARLEGARDRSLPCSLLNYFFISYDPFGPTRTDKSSSGPADFPRAAGDALLLSCAIRSSTLLSPRPQTTSEPTSLQRRKHQINQLAVQAANMERDLLERSGASRLTKAQTQAKYGW